MLFGVNGHALEDTAATVESCEVISGSSDSTMMGAAISKKRRNCQASTSVYVPKRDIKHHW